MTLAVVAALPYLGGRFIEACKDSIEAEEVAQSLWNVDPENWTEIESAYPAMEKLKDAEGRTVVIVNGRYILRFMKGGGPQRETIP